MRHLTVLLAVVLAPLFCVSQSISKTADTQTTFGRYGNCTSGRGLCGITVSESTPSKPTAGNYSKIISEQSFILTLNRSNLRPEDEIRIAGKPLSQIRPDENLYFTQMDPLLVSKLSLQNLEMGVSANTIYPGNYPMFVSKDKIEILFTLRN